MFHVVLYGKTTRVLVPSYVYKEACHLFVLHHYSSAFRIVQKNQTDSPVKT